MDYIELIVDITEVSYFEVNNYFLTLERLRIIPTLECVKCSGYKFPFGRPMFFDDTFSAKYF